MKDIIVNLKKRYKGQYKKHITTELQKKIIQSTNFLPENSPLSQRIFYILNNLTSNPKCKTGGKEIILTNQLKEYCSHKCVYNSPDVKLKLKETNLKRYGVENPAKSKQSKEKMKETNLKKYGVECYSKTPEFVKKMKETNLERYGVEAPIQSKEIMQKITETNLKKYGTKSPSQCKEVKEKIKQTNFKRYGVEIPAQSKDIMQKIKETNLEKYGVESYSKTDEFQEKYKQTCIEKYGVDNYSKSQQFKDNYKDVKLNSRVELLKGSDVEVVDLKNDVFTYKCKKCGHIWQGSYTNFYPICRKCYPISHSKFETEVADYIKSLGISNVISNDRELIKPLELDILLPDFNLAIECNGIFWHKEEIKGKDYHQKKTNLCKDKGIQLIHIWEDWWINKKEIVKSILFNKLNLNTIKIFGRDCKIKEVNFKQTKQFLEENHIQGFINSSINLGLFYKGELVSLMTFGKSRYDKNYQWELLRFCNKKFINVIGGASKLFKHFEKNYKGNIISYALMDISDGKMYNYLGFTLKGFTQPNYFYVKDLERESRIKYQKHKLKDILEKYDETLSEKDNMFLNGYSVVYDSGSLIFSKGDSK